MAKQRGVFNASSLHPAMQFGHIAGLEALRKHTPSIVAKTFSGHPAREIGI